MWNVLWVGLGGFVGASARYLAGLLPLHARGGFPAVTFGINLLGAFFIGLIAESALKNHTENTGLTLFLKTGVCGGFTTFSTFSLESVQLLSNGKQVTAVCYMVLSVVCCLAGVACGQLVARKIG